MTDSQTAIFSQLNLGENAQVVAYNFVTGSQVANPANFILKGNVNSTNGF